MPRAISRSIDYTRRFHQVREKNHLKIEQQKQILEHESHLFIVVLGAMIGSILSIFIAYHLTPNFIEYALLSAIPFALAYSLRKVYIHTLIHSQE
ncbi:FUSC family protein [Acinetobacter sp.]|uniref:FUSC family protein n=1 Tax=Acinetobacter sp. TaxID=472 RepID=UPI002647CACC|nr:FUSC family protein [Acinetobacter sp.]MDN5512605.1 FUSC family protein [Acinetobacter sp.]MDN5524791.1 FUSC family protein [Acinetobacter sp.]